MLVGGIFTEPGDLLAAALVVDVTLGILREPAAKHPHLLGEDLVDAPEA